MPYFYVRENKKKTVWQICFRCEVLVWCYVEYRTGCETNPIIEMFKCRDYRVKSSPFSPWLLTPLHRFLVAPCPPATGLPYLLYFLPDPWPCSQPGHPVWPVLHVQCVSTDPLPLGQVSFNPLLYLMCCRCLSSWLVSILIPVLCFRSLQIIAKIISFYNTLLIGLFINENFWMTMENEYFSDRHS